jgi:hypothetical protein
VLKGPVPDLRIVVLPLPQDHDQFKVESLVFAEIHDIGHRELLILEDDVLILDKLQDFSLIASHHDVSEALFLQDRTFVDCGQFVESRASLDFVVGFRDVGREMAVDACAGEVEVEGVLLGGVSLQSLLFALQVLALLQRERSFRNLTE